MSLANLPAVLHDDAAITAALGRQTNVLAVAEPGRAIAIAALVRQSERRPIVVAVPTSTDAERLANDLRAFMGDDQAMMFPAWETLPFERVSPSTETMGRRLEVMWRLRSPDRAPAIVVAPVRALIQRLGPHVEDAMPLIIEKGGALDEDNLAATLASMGYRREYQVEHRGEFAVRGSIVDVFPSTADDPVRIDLWDLDVDRLMTFSVGDQRSVDDLDRVEIFGCRELLPTDEVRERAQALIATEPWGREQWERLAEGQIFDGMESWLPWLTADEHVLFDLLDSDGQVLLVEPRRMRDRAADLLAEEADLANSLAVTWGAVEAGADHGFPSLHLEFDRLLKHTDAPVLGVDATPDSPDVPVVQVSGWDPVVGGPSAVAEQITRMIDRGWQVVVCGDTAGTAKRLATVLSDQGLDFKLALDGPPNAKLRGDIVPGGYVVAQPLDRGCVLNEPKLAVISEIEFTGRRRAHRAARPRKRQAQSFFDGLTKGDYVVHHQHGVAKYQGMVTRAIGGAERDYLLLDYRGDDKLYVPSDQIDAVRPYTGGDSPSLSRLNGSEWIKAKARVRSAVAEIAQELVVLYQKRVSTPGLAFSPDTPWQAELEEAFPFEETPDQLKAITEVKADMETASPMDRLVCGDVGFGKTEVAVRAAFKAVQEGKQVAILVPTTLLAQQHFQTFSERFAGYPLRVEVLSRFLTAKQAKVVVEGVVDGTVDVVIGTHRLLSQDITFKNLGLLVVDEEQRFGVTHKERIKEFQANVDVLTLSATPIPRTLEMSLTGIRDLTLLQTPPADRQPILTFVGEYDDRAVAESIRRELLREGQVFYVHNRVHDIEKAAAHIKELVPEARVCIAHGQMDEGSLEQVVIDFWEGQYDVLVCTTIIESGIDMPTVNTLVVKRADLMGLGQLHQLRGRVGRSGQRAYAYLFYPPNVSLSEEAYERLKTIGEATELGSGFKIAMRDLEIRGTGNLLGHTQSGHISAVGYDLYCQMVTEAVAELKGEPVKVPAEVKIDVPYDAHLPSDYVSREELRLEAYQRLATVTTDAQVDDVLAEWQDRFGPPPEPAEALLKVARLRAECHRVGVKEIVVGEGASHGSYRARIAPIDLLASQQIRLKRLYKRAIYKQDLRQLLLPIGRSVDVVDGIVTFMRDIVPPEA